MFASFWNRNNALRALQRSAKNYHAMLEAEKKVWSPAFVNTFIYFFLYKLIEILLIESLEI